MRTRGKVNSSIFCDLWTFSNLQKNHKYDFNYSDWPFKISTSINSKFECQNQYSKRIVRNFQYCCEGFYQSLLEIVKKMFVVKFMLILCCCNIISKSVESAKALLRVDKIKFKGTNYCNLDLAYKNFRNGSFAIDAFFQVSQNVVQQMVTVDLWNVIYFSVTF